MNAYELADKLETDKWDEATIVLSIDAGIKLIRQQADRIAELEKQVEHYKNKAEYLDKRELELLAEEYQKTHEGFSTIQEVIARHEAIPSRKEAIDKARQCLKDFRIEVSYVHLHKELSDEEIANIEMLCSDMDEYGHSKVDSLAFARAIIKASRGVE